MIMHRYAWLMLVASSMTVAAQEAQRPHAYVFADPELVSTQRVFGLGNATMLLGNACEAFPEAVTSYDAWLQRNQATMSSLTQTLATHYRIAGTLPDVQARVAQAMHLPTALDLSAAKLDDVCPTLPATLALPNLDLQQRYQASLVEVRDPDYLSLKRKQAISTPPVETSTPPVETPATEETP